MEKYGIRYWGLFFGIIGLMFSIIWCQNPESVEEEIIENVESLEDSVVQDSIVQDSVRWDSVIKEYREHESDGEITLLIPIR